MTTLDPAAIDAAITGADADTPFSGAAMIRQQGSILFARGYGDANRAEGIPNAPDIRYATASGSKIFTAVSVLQLIEAGRFGLDTSLRDVLDIPYRLDPAVRVRHLLVHCSGLPDYYDEEELDEAASLAIWEEKPLYTLRQPEDYLPLFMDRPPKFAPGARFHYNNGAFVLLALLVKQHSGMDFPDYVARHIFQPAGMTDSGYFRLDELPPRTACGYIPNGDGSCRTNIYALPVIGSGDGGAFVSAPDWGRFWDALYSGRLLSEAMMRTMLEPQIDTGHPTLDRRYGLGIWLVYRDGAIHERYVVGSDFGVGMVSAVYSRYAVEMTLLANIEETVWPAWGALAKLFDAAFAQSGR
ncbi:MAG: serine hydrolase [Anaerolineae bacterium]|nr:serine hydrolase [Anaerolineae bacterium]